MRRVLSAITDDAEITCEAGLTASSPTRTDEGTPHRAQPDACSKKSSGIRGQSEVVGVILLIAVTVIIVTIIGVALFDVWMTETEDEPRINIESSLNETELTVKHQGGDSVSADRIIVFLEGAVNQQIRLDEFDVTDGDRFEAGTRWKHNENLQNTPVSGTVTIFVLHEPSDTILHEDTHEVD